MILIKVGQITQLTLIDERNIIMIYDVYIEERLCKRVSLEADTLDEAYQLAWDNYKNAHDDYVLYPEHFVDVDIDIESLDEEFGANCPKQ